MSEDVLVFFPVGGELGRAGLAEADAVPPARAAQREGGGDRRVRLLMSKDGRPRVESTTLVPGRVPLLVRYPPLVKPGTVVNDIAAHEDMLLTLVNAAGGVKGDKFVLSTADMGISVEKAITAGRPWASTLKRSYSAWAERTAASATRIAASCWRRTSTAWCCATRQARTR